MTDWAAEEAALRRVRTVGAHVKGGRIEPGSSSYGRVHGEVSRAPLRWEAAAPRALAAGASLREVVYEKSAAEGGGGGVVARLTINRPSSRNAFTPLTVQELSLCLDDARDDAKVGVVVLRGAGEEAFCSGGDQRVRGDGGYVGADGVPRLNVLDLQMQIRRLPKPVVASVAGFAVGGGHILHMCCDITIAADNGVFGQTGPRVGSFDAGYGSTAMSRLIGPKRAKEMWFLSRLYTAEEAMQMGLVNVVVPLADLEVTTAVWCREMLRNSPSALRFIKNAVNAADDGHAGLQQLGGDLTVRARARPAPGAQPPRGGRPTWTHRAARARGACVDGANDTERPADDVLRHRGGPRGPRGVQGRPAARFLAVRAPAVTAWPPHVRWDGDAFACLLALWLFSFCPLRRRPRASVVWMRTKASRANEPKNRPPAAVHHHVCP